MISQTLKRHLVALLITAAICAPLIYMEMQAP